MNIDYNIYDRLGLRLVDPSPDLAKLAVRQMDPIRPNALPGMPDVSITAIREGAPETTYRLGDAGDRQECAFSNSGFCILNGGKMLFIPFEAIGGSCDIRYVPGVALRRAFLNYVRPILQLSLLSRGSLAVHSAAVSHKGKGILLAGWAESGKTEAMLGFLHNGASFVSDKWTIVTEGGSSVLNFPTPITVRGWMLKQLPELGENLKPLELWRARIATYATSLSQRVRKLSNVEATRLLDNLVNLGSRVSVTPDRLFGSRNGSAFAGRMTPEAPLVAMFLLMTTNSSQICVRPVRAEEAARRLSDCAEYERRGLLNLYTKFRYAFPDRRSAVIEESRQLEAEMLTTALASKEVFIVETPFPFDPLAIYAAISPFC